MLRCVNRGCPTRCGSRRTPSCAERMLYYALLLLLTIVFLSAPPWGHAGSGKPAQSGSGVSPAQAEVRTLSQKGQRWPLMPSRSDLNLASSTCYARFSRWRPDCISQIEAQPK